MKALFSHILTPRPLSQASNEKTPDDQEEEHEPIN